MSVLLDPRALSAMGMNPAGQGQQMAPAPVPTPSVIGAQAGQMPAMAGQGFGSRFKEAMPSILQALGIGIARGDLASGASAFGHLYGAQQGRQQAQMEQQQQAMGANVTAGSLRKRGYHDLADMVEARVLTGKQALDTAEERDKAKKDRQSANRPKLETDGMGRKFWLYPDGRAEPFQSPFDQPSGGQGGQMAGQAYNGPPRSKQEAEFMESRKQQSAAVESAENLLSVLDRIESHPGADLALGAFQGERDELGRPTATAKATRFLQSAAPGGRKYQDAADFDALVDTARGGTFLKAYESLKGGGQITEVEGRKAEQALATMQTTQSPEAFMKNLRIYRDIIENGIARAKGIDVPENQLPSVGGGMPDLSTMSDEELRRIANGG